MRIGVIRGDMPGPVALMDLETVSQYNPSTEPKGQERRLGRPDPDVVGGLLPASTLLGTVDISGGATVVVATSDDLLVKTDSTALFDTATVAAAVYASGDTLVDAINAALVAAGSLAVASLDETGTYLVLSSNVVGEDSYIEVETAAGGSNINSLVGLNVLGDSFTMPSGSAAILALSPIGGPLDVSDATVAATVGEGVTAAQITSFADAIAPLFVETDVAIKSFQVGMLSGYRSASYNPDPNRLPAITPGAAISVVQNDGVTAFAAPLTVVAGAVHDVPSAGAITITGTNLGDPEVQATVVKVTAADGSSLVKLHQAVIEGAQGSVNPTAIVIPASLLNGLGAAAGSTVIVQYTSFASNVSTTT